MKEVKYTKTHAKIQVGVSFHMRDIWKKFYLNFKSFVGRGRLVPLLCWAPTWQLETSRNISLAEFNCNESVNFS